MPTCEHATPTGAYRVHPLSASCAVLQWWRQFVASGKAAEAANEPDERPMSPNGRRRVVWARKTTAAVPMVEAATDQKYRLQRLLLSPHAALVLRYDGALLRVVNVTGGGDKGARPSLSLYISISHYLLCASPVARHSPTATHPPPLTHRAVLRRAVLRRGQSVQSSSRATATTTAPIGRPPRRSAHRRRY